MLCPFSLQCSLQYLPCGLPCETVQLHAGCAHFVSLTGTSLAQYTARALCSVAGNPLDRGACLGEPEQRRTSGAVARDCGGILSPPRHTCWGKERRRLLGQAHSPDPMLTGYETDYRWLTQIYVSVQPTRELEGEADRAPADGTVCLAASTGRKASVLNILSGGRYRTRTYDLVRVKHAL